MRIAVAQLNPTIGAFVANGKKIIAAIERAKKEGADLVLFSELVLCGYPPEDLLLLHSFVEACAHELQKIAEATKGIIAVVGTVQGNRNSAAIIVDGKIIGYQDKSRLPTYDVFDEERYFEPAEEMKLWELCGEKVLITICEDIWSPLTPQISLKPTLHLNLSASPYSMKHSLARREVLCRAAKELGAPSVLCNQVGGNDSLIFSGSSIAVDKEGRLCAQLKSFEEDFALIDWNPIPEQPHDRLGDLYSALVLGVRDYFQKSGFSKAVIGLSGGIDSSLVASIAVDALGANNTLGLLMPSRYTSQASIEDAFALASNLGIETRIFSIESVFESYKGLLNSPGGTTEENIQARIRGMILMAISNSEGHIVLSTGNKSESAMGYATLYGDMCGGLSVINDVTKVQVYALCRFLGDRIPPNVIAKPPSAELSEGQLDSDSLPDYSVVDTILEDYVERHIPPAEIAKKHSYDLALVEDLVSRIHRNEYKRRQAPPGLRVSEKAFSIGRRFPIVQHWQ